MFHSLRTADLTWPGLSHYHPVIWCVCFNACGVAAGWSLTRSRSQERQIWGGCSPVCSLSARLKLKNQLKRGEGRKTGSGEWARVFRVVSDWTAQVFSFMSPHEVSRATAVIGLDFDCGLEALCLCWSEAYTHTELLHEHTHTVRWLARLYCGYNKGKHDITPDIRRLRSLLAQP